MDEANPVKQEVRQFYDRVGWQVVGAQGEQQIYQNARYEDLRPVSQEYIHRCHLRVARHLPSLGRMLLDAGSGPIQYPEYLVYSQGYTYRVCADISITALQEARKRIGEHGLFVVADVAHMPFMPGAFDGLVSLHTIHHLPESEHLQAYLEFHRLLAAGGSAVVVNGWPDSRLMQRFEPLVRFANRLRSFINRRRGDAPDAPRPRRKVKVQRLEQPGSDPEEGGLRGTFTNRHGVAWMKGEVGAYMPLEIWVWRSVNVRFLRALIHPWLAGRLWLKLLYRLEERWPHYFGENGQYPLVVLRKPRVSDKMEMSN